MNLNINVPYQEDGRSSKRCYLRKHFGEYWKSRLGFESKLDKISYTDFKHGSPFRLAPLIICTFMSNFHFLFKYKIHHAEKWRTSLVTILILVLWANLLGALLLVTLDF